jgi:hypothetical protein
MSLHFFKIIMDQTSLWQGNEYFYKYFYCNQLKNNVRKQYFGLIAVAGLSFASSTNFQQTIRNIFFFFLAYNILQANYILPKPSILTISYLSDYFKHNQFFPRFYFFSCCTFFLGNVSLQDSHNFSVSILPANKIDFSLELWLFVLVLSCNRRVSLCWNHTKSDFSW